MTDLDIKLINAEEQARREGSLTPLIKEELWCKIQVRRMSEGLEELKVDFTAKSAEKVSWNWTSWHWSNSINPTKWFGLNTPYVFKIALHLQYTNQVLVEWIQIKFVIGLDLVKSHAKFRGDTISRSRENCYFWKFSGYFQTEIVSSVLIPIPA